MIEGKKMKQTQILSMVAFSALLLTAAVDKANAAEEKQYESNGAVEFMPNMNPTDPVDPTDPDPENPVKPVDPTDPDGPDPGTQGPLSIDYASSFDFGLNRISNKNQTYYARAQKYFDGTADTPNFVQVTDNRGTNGGWTLQVRQEDQLKATVDTLNKELTGSVIKISDPVVNSNAQNVEKPVPVDITLVPGKVSPVASAKSGAGAGTWSVAWGKVETVKETDQDGKDQDVNVTKAVQLTVPGSTPKDAVKYQTKLTWILTDVPGN